LRSGAWWRKAHEIVKFDGIRPGLAGFLRDAMARYAAARI
jgi:hypothetical protein